MVVRDNERLCHDEREDVFVQKMLVLAEIKCAVLTVICTIMSNSCVITVNGA